MSSPLLLSKRILPLIIAGLLAGCASNGGIDDDNFDVDESELPPLASLSVDQIFSSSKKCQSEITQLWDMKSSVPKSRLKEFHLMIGKTSEACSRLQSYVNELRKAGLAEKYYLQNLQTTRALVNKSEHDHGDTPVFTDIENAPMMKPKKKTAVKPKRIQPSESSTAYVEADDPMAELNPHLPRVSETYSSESLEAFDPSLDDE